MLVARFIVGTGTTINSAARFYVAAATLVAERTRHIALFSLFQTMGFIFGPLIMVGKWTITFPNLSETMRNVTACQAGLAFLGHKPVSDGGSMVFDMYTLTA